MLNRPLAPNHYYLLMCFDFRTVRCSDIVDSGNSIWFSVLIDYG